MTTYEPRLFQSVVIAKALRIYAKHKRQVNRAYTPTAMLRTASSITGKKFRRGQYIAAAEALEAHVASMRQNLGAA
jgi:uncharacterized protein with FMN-binding domain